MATPLATACTLLLLLVLAVGRGLAADAARADMVVFVKEQCHQPGLDMHALRQLVEERAHSQLNIKFVASTGESTLLHTDQLVYIQRY